MSKKSSSVDFIKKTFDSKLVGRWYGEPEIVVMFIELYIEKKYSDILHYIPFNFISLVQMDTTKGSGKRIYKYLMHIEDWKADKFYEYSTQKSKNDSAIDNYFKLYKNTRKRFTFYPIAYTQQYSDGRKSSHLQLFLYDSKSNEIEMFDSTTCGCYYPDFKGLIKSFFFNIYGKNVKIVHLKKCMLFGIIEDDKFKNYLFTSRGWCAIWALWFLELRLKNKSKSREFVIDKALKMIKGESQEICKIIRGYSQFVQKTVKNYEVKVEGEKYLAIVRKKYKFEIPRKLIGLLGVGGALLYTIKKLNFLFQK